MNGLISEKEISEIRFISDISCNNCAHSSLRNKGYINCKLHDADFVIYSWCSDFCSR